MSGNGAPAPPAAPASTRATQGKGPTAVELPAAVAAALWPPSRLGEALDVAARSAGARRRGTAAPRASADVDGVDVAATGRWLRVAGAALDVTTDEVTLRHAELARDLPRLAPALLQIGGGFLVLVGRTRGGHVRAASPDGRHRPLPAADVAHALAAELEARAAPVARGVLDAANVPDARRARAERSLMEQQLAHATVRGAFVVRRAAGAPFGHAVRDAGIPRAVGALVAAHAVAYALGLGSWWVLGRGVLDGLVDAGWLAAWALLLATALPLRTASLALEGHLALTVGRLFKERLLAGALRLDKDEIRKEGVGDLLGRVLESESVEHLATAGAFAIVLGGVELVFLVAVLARGAGGALHAATLAGWAALVGAGVGHMYTRRRALVDARLANTRALVERMIGHRTRLAQEPPERWHAGEDELLDGYLTAAREADRAALLAQVVLGRGWLPVGFAALVPALLANDATSSDGLARVAVSLGGILLADRALARLAAGLAAVADGAIAWRAVRPLFEAAARRAPAGEPSLASAGARAGEGDVVLEARDVVLRHDARAEPILRGCSLTLRHGDRVLLEGPSGGGKSTLATVLAGLRAPTHGLVTLHGLDLGALGAEGWRRRVALAPQFHDNHVLAGPFGLNALLGDRWPPLERDLEEARAVCEELGLGELLARMPGGLFQTVGDTGWRLSHGEQSRLFLARALLQRAEVVLLDESFAALDPENLERCLATAARRSPTLLVIAHP